MTDPFVVVGADAAGLSAASKFRRERPDRDVVVFERGQFISYAHCGTPYFVEGRVSRLSDLLSLSPADVEDRGIDLRRGHEVVAVDPETNTVRVRAADGTTSEQPYSEVLVATGAHAVTGSFDVQGPAGAFTLHGLNDAAAIDAYIADPEEYDPDSADAAAVDRDRVDRAAAHPAPETAAIVGGGYVGVEMAEALRGRGLDVHLFQRSDRLLPPFGAAVGDRVASTLAAHEVTVHTNTSVDAILGDDRVEAVRADGRTVPVELAIVGVGIEPTTAVTDGTAVECGPRGAIRTDRYGETAEPGVYAAGDCAASRHAVTGEETWIPLGLTANRAGRAVGATVAGDPTPVGDVAGTAVVKAFEMECGRVGLATEAAAGDAGFDPVSETITAGSRSGYYPGAAETDVTLVADADSGRLLGGSIAGTDRAAVRIDTLATAIHAELSVAAVERLDLAYAPPFSPVWDPVLVAAKVLRGSLES
mgnify:FL=1